MLRKSFLIGLVLILCGYIAFEKAWDEKKQEQRETALYKIKYASDLDDYFEKYNEWLTKSPSEREKLPWGLGQNGKTKSDIKLKLEQHQRLKADLDILAVTDPNSIPFADILYGSDWQEELNKYKSQKEKLELRFTASLVCMSAGGVASVVPLLIWTVRLIIEVFSKLKRYLIIKFKTERAKRHASQNAASKGKKDKGRKRPRRGDKYLKILANSGWQNIELEKAKDIDSAKKQPNKSKEEEESVQSQKAIALTNRSKWYDFKNKDKINEKGSVARNLSSDDGEKPAVVICGDEQTGPSTDFSLKHQDWQSSQNYNGLETEGSEPLRTSLAELTEQISAIREYASSQQEKIKRLQEGYDWNIVKNFCIRIIHCIDNLDTRIECLNRQDADTFELEEVRDELIFALESSGVEQFQPQLNSEYRGQEKIAEAAKERQYCDDADLSGKIAEILRPGYRYLIDEENVRVIRAAQVKLYGQVK
jgi:molecular chaperone GrpE (heat shock protein)